MYKSVVSYALGALALFGNSALAEESCDSYSVVAGDTLREISQSYYGSRDFSAIIYRENIDIIGDDPNTIEIGMNLSVPCREGMQMPLETAFLAVSDPAENSAALALPAGFAPKFLAKAGNSPFISSDSTGILPDILAAALRSGGYTDELDLSRPEAAPEVMELAALPGSLLTFPIVKPDCGTPALISAQSQMLCENFAFSNPLFEITLGVFTRAETPLIESLASGEYTGMRFCIPSFHNDNLLRAHGIMSQDISATVEPGLQSCLTKLQSGEYEAVVADYMSIMALQPDGVVDMPDFAKKTTLHAVAHTRNPEALATLQIVNAGLRAILDSGEWFGIVNARLPVRMN